MIDDVDELLALRAGDKYRLNDIRRRLEIYKRLYISDLEFVRNLSKAYLGKDLSPEPRRPRPGSSEEPQAELAPEPEPYVAPEPSAAPKPRQVQAATGKKSRQQELEEYERQYLNRSGIKDGAEGFTITEDGEVGEKTKKKSSKPRKAAKKTKKTAKKTRKPRKKKEPNSSSCVKCGSKIGPDDMFCTNCGSKR
jgi:pyruvate/2-oxoglutarate dehydrogenase complex dihydrolipoamide acyltransferase (E2) component